MSLRFRVVKRTVRLGKYAGKSMQVARVISSGRVNFQQFCREVADGSTLTSADVKAVVDRMAYIIRRNVEAGRSVEVQDLGIFGPRIGSQLVMDGEEFNPVVHINSTRIGFRGKKSFYLLDGITLERISKSEELARSAVSAKRKATPKKSESSEETSSSSSGTGGVVF